MDSEDDISDRGNHSARKRQACDSQDLLELGRRESIEEEFRVYSSLLLKKPKCKSPMQSSTSTNKEEIQVQASNPGSPELPANQSQHEREQILDGDDDQQIFAEENVSTEDESDIYISQEFDHGYCTAGTTDLGKSIYSQETISLSQLSIDHSQETISSGHYSAVSSQRTGSSGQFVNNYSQETNSSRRSKTSSSGESTSSSSSSSGSPSTNSKLLNSELKHKSQKVDDSEPLASIPLVDVDVGDNIKKSGTEHEIQKESDPEVEQAANNIVYVDTKLGGRIYSFLLQKFKEKQRPYYDPQFEEMWDTVGTQYEICYESKRLFPKESDKDIIEKDVGTNKAVSHIEKTVGIGVENDGCVASTSPNNELSKDIKISPENSASGSGNWLSPGQRAAWTSIANREKSTYTTTNQTTSTWSPLNKQPVKQVVFEDSLNNPSVADAEGNNCFEWSSQSSTSSQAGPSSSKTIIHDHAAKSKKRKDSEKRKIKRQNVDFSFSDANSPNNPSVTDTQGNNCFKESSQSSTSSQVGPSSTRTVIHNNAKKSKKRTDSEKRQIERPNIDFNLSNKKSLNKPSVTDTQGINCFDRSNQASTSSQAGPSSTKTVIHNNAKKSKKRQNSEKRKFEVPNIDCNFSDEEVYALYPRPKEKLSQPSTQCKPALIEKRSSEIGAPSNNCSNSLSDEGIDTQSSSLRQNIDQSSTHYTPQAIQNRRPEISRSSVHFFDSSSDEGIDVTPIFNPRPKRDKPSEPYQPQRIQHRRTEITTLSFSQLDDSFASKFVSSVSGNNLPEQSTSSENQNSQSSNTSVCTSKSVSPIRIKCINSQPVIKNRQNENLNQGQARGKKTVKKTKPKYCICQGKSRGTRWVLCGNENCEIKWFHWACVKIYAYPNYDWYCSKCGKNSASDGFSKQ